MQMAVVMMMTTIRIQMMTVMIILVLESLEATISLQATLLTCRWSSSSSLWGWWWSCKWWLLVVKTLKVGNSHVLQALLLTFIWWGWGRFGIEDFSTSALVLFHPQNANLVIVGCNWILLKGHRTSHFQVNVRLSQRPVQEKVSPVDFSVTFSSVWPKKSHRLRFCAKIGSLLWTRRMYYPPKAFPLWYLWQQGNIQSGTEDPQL